MDSSLDQTALHGTYIPPPTRQNLEKVISDRIARRRAAEAAKAAEKARIAALPEKEKRLAEIHGRQADFLKKQREEHERKVAYLQTMAKIPPRTPDEKKLGIEEATVLHDLFSIRGFKYFLIAIVVASFIYITFLWAYNTSLLSPPSGTGTPVTSPNGMTLDANYVCCPKGGEVGFFDIPWYLHILIVVVVLIGFGFCIYPFKENTLFKIFKGNEWQQYQRDSFYNTTKNTKLPILIAVVLLCIEIAIFAWANKEAGTSIAPVVTPIIDPTTKLPTSYTKMCTAGQTIAYSCANPVFYTVIYGVLASAIVILIAYKVYKYYLGHLHAESAGELGCRLGQIQALADRKKSAEGYIDAANAIYTCATHKDLNTTNPIEIKNMVRAYKADIESADEMAEAEGRHEQIKLWHDYMESHDTDAHKHMIRDRIAPRDLRREGRDGLDARARVEMEKHNDSDRKVIHWMPAKATEVPYKLIDSDGHIIRDKVYDLARRLDVPPPEGTWAEYGYTGKDDVISGLKWAWNTLKGAFGQSRDERDAAAQATAEEEQKEYKTQREVRGKFDQIMIDNDHEITPRVIGALETLKDEYPTVV